MASHKRPRQHSRDVQRFARRAVLYLMSARKTIGKDERVGMLFLHGGGFVRGDKSEKDNIGYYFARSGRVVMVSAAGAQPFAAAIRA